MRRWLSADQIRQAVDRPRQSVQPLNRPPADLPLSEWGRRFLPHYFRCESSLFHRALDRDLDGLHLRRGSRIARIAPRESAKSTWVTLAYLLRCSVEGWEPYSLILSDTARQAGKLLRDVRHEIETNAAIREAYPESAGVGPKWAETAIQLRNGVTIECLGAGNKIRGNRAGASRPSLMILDDLQSNDDIQSAILRERTYDWVTREVIPAGSESTNFVSIGTALHRECVAVKLLTAPNWRGQVFQAVLDWPERMDLWQEWERRLTNLANEFRQEDAEEFYAANQAEMLRGSRVLWEAYKPLKSLMSKRAEIGPSAFDTEFQGNPKSSVGAEWPSEYFERPGMYFDEWPELVVKASALDPSKGKTDKPGDWQAHVWGGVDRAGTLFVDAEFRREPVAEMVARSIQRCRELNNLGGRTATSALVVETNIFGELLSAEFDRQAKETTGGLLPLRPVEHYEPKPVRIRKTDAPLSRSQIRVKNTLGGRELVSQWRDFPTGSHDDGPDAFAMWLDEIRRLTAGPSLATGTPRQSLLGYDPRKRSY